MEGALRANGQKVHNKNTFYQQSANLRRALRFIMKGSLAFRGIFSSVQSIETSKFYCQAAVIIATDGASSDGDLAVAMKPLEQLPVEVNSLEIKLVVYFANIYIYIYRGKRSCNFNIRNSTCLVT